MEQKVKRRNYNLRGKKEIENKVISNEHTPPKSIVPRAHSTPVEFEIVSKDASESESDDSDEEPAFCFTQDTLEVQWDYSNTPKGKEKKKHSKIKRKSKAGTLAKNKRRHEFSPIEAVKIRKRYIKEEPKADLNKLIAGLQALAEKVKKEKGLHKNEMQKNLPSEFCSINNVEDHLDEDIHRSRCSKSVRKQLLAPSSPNPGLKEEVVSLTVKENFTSLFDDDADDCIVRCSQEVEQKLHEPDSVYCMTEQLPSYSVKNSDLNENAHQNHHNDTAMGKQSVKTSEDCLTIDIEIEKNGCHLSDGQELKESCILPTDLVKNAQHGINESFTALLEDDADDCMLLCSQEIEEKLKDKHIDDNVAKRLPSNIDFQNSNTDKYAVSSSNKKIQTNDKKAKSDSGIFTSSTSNVGFDDSLDVLLQNFTEEDIDKMSQGVSVKKKVNSSSINSYKQHFHKSDDNLTSNSVVKTTIDCKMPVTSRSVDQFTNYKHSKPFNLGNIVNKLAAVTSIKTQCKVSNVMSTNANGVKLNRNLPVLNNITVYGSMERNLNTNSILQDRTSYIGTNNYLKTDITRPNSLLKIAPQKCSPEEIEKKRLEARKKLEMKKLSMMQEKRQHSHPSRWS